jgi:pimeloyl-ACP methyl ester carboxylesterase
VVARGSDDDDLPPRFAAPAADALPDGRLVVLDGLDHFAPLADEAAVARSMTAELG